MKPKKNIKKKADGENKLDRINCQLINLLQKDGRMPNTMIAKKLGISEATVRTRLDRLIKDGIIFIRSISNPYKLGFKIVGNMKIRINNREIDNVLKELYKIKELFYIAVMTGETDIDADFNLNSLDGLNNLIFTKINKIPGIIRLETSIILKFIKRDYNWGTAFD